MYARGVPRVLNVAHRDALLMAATRVIADQGLAATTATIARGAGVSAGTLFVHFENKAALVNQLYVTLKTEMGAAAADGLRPDAPSHDQLQQLWRQWIGWATGTPEKRAALAHLDVAAEITAQSRRAVRLASAATGELLERCRADGPMRAVPLAFVLRVLSAIADATIDDLIQRPGAGRAADDPRSRVAFDAIWRSIAGSTSGGTP